jgi:putative phage-type endonuclease
MSFVEVLPWDAPREEWLQARHAGVGSSDIAILMGLSNWDSPFGLYHRKTGGLGEQEELERMRWGRKLEVVIAEEFAERHPEFKLFRCGLVRSAERLYQQATPDRLLYETTHETITSPATGETHTYWAGPMDYPHDLYPGDEGWPEPVGALEVKTDESFDEWGPDGTDEIPVKYRAQVLWQADCLGLPGVHMAALLPGKKYREYYVAHDEADLKLMRAAAEEFMDRVARLDPPDVDGHPATIDTLRALHPDLDDTEVQVPATLARQWAAACAAEKRAKARKKTAEAKLRDRMGRARVAVHGGEKVATRVISTVTEHVRAESTRDYLNPPRETA